MRGGIGSGIVGKIGSGFVGGIGSGVVGRVGGGVVRRGGTVGIGDDGVGIGAVVETVG